MRHLEVQMDSIGRPREAGEAIRGASEGRRMLWAIASRLISASLQSANESWTFWEKSLSP